MVKYISNYVANIRVISLNWQIIYTAIYKTVFKCFTLESENEDIKLYD